MKCYRCGVRGHIASQCESRCRECGFPHKNTPCINLLTDYLRELNELRNKAYVRTTEMYRRALNETTINEVIDLMIKTESAATRVRQHQDQITMGIAKKRLENRGITIRNIFNKKKSDTEHSLLKKYFTNDAKLYQESLKEYEEEVKAEMARDPKKLSLEEFILSTLERYANLSLTKQLKQHKNQVTKAAYSELDNMIKKGVDEIKESFLKAKEERNNIREKYLAEMRKEENKNKAAGLYLKMKVETKRVNDANKSLINYIKETTNEQANDIIKGKRILIGSHKSELLSRIEEVQQLYLQKKSTWEELDQLDEQFGIYESTRNRRVNMKLVMTHDTFVQEQVKQHLETLKKLNELINKYSKKI
jgi:hypothetical protein